MIWQASIWNPRIFTDYKPNLEEKHKTILNHLDYYIACDQRFDEIISNKSEKINIQDLEIPLNWIENRCSENKNKVNFQPHTIIEFRKFLFQYVKWIPWSKERKQQVLNCKDYLELKEFITALFQK